MQHQNFQDELVSLFCLGQNIKSDNYFKQLKRVGNYFQQTLQLPAACLKFRWSENKIVSGFYFCGYLWISQYLWILLLRQSIRLCDCGSMSGYSV